MKIERSRLSVGDWCQGETARADSEEQRNKEKEDGG